MDCERPVVTSSRGLGHSAADCGQEEEEEDGDGEEEDDEEDDEDPTLLVSLELVPRVPLDASLQFSSKDASAGGALGLGELLKEVEIFRQGALATGGALKEAGQGKPGAFAVSSKEAG